MNTTHGGTAEADDELVSDNLRAARRLATADLDPRDAVHDAASLQEMLTFVLEQLDRRSPTEHGPGVGKITDRYLS